ncbi:MAG: motility-associated protein, partial [Thiogranum sp.]
MDMLSMVGIMLALVAIIGGNILEGGHTSSLVQLTAFVIVSGGTLGAVMVQTPIRTFVRAMGMASWVFIPLKLQPEEIAEKIVSWSNIARREGLLGLEAIA